MNKRAVIQLLAAALVVAAGWWWFTRRSGEEDFRKAQEAMKSVRSFRAQISNGPGEITLIAHECPSSQHITRRSAAGEGAYSSEEIQVGADMFYLDAGTRSWVRGSVPVEFPGLLCNRLSTGQDTEPFPPFTEMTRRGMFSQGSVVKVSGTKCREWLVQIVHPLGTRKETVCLGVDDFLPKQWKVEGTEALYSDWNKPMNIGAPQAAAYRSDE